MMSLPAQYPHQCRRPITRPNARATATPDRSRATRFGSDGPRNPCVDPRKCTLQPSHKPRRGQKGEEAQAVVSKPISRLEGRGREAGAAAGGLDRALLCGWGGELDLEIGSTIYERGSNDRIEFFVFVSGLCGGALFVSRDWCRSNQHFEHTRRAPSHHPPVAGGGVVAEDDDEKHCSVVGICFAFLFFLFFCFLFFFNAHLVVVCILVYLWYAQPVDFWLGSRRCRCCCCCDC
jgi:hypothetical protein